MVIIVQRPVAVTIKNHVTTLPGGVNARRDIRDILAANCVQTECTATTVCSTANAHRMRSATQSVANAYANLVILVKIVTKVNSNYNFCATYDKRQARN